VRFRDFTNFKKWKNLGKLYLTYAKPSTGFCEMNKAKKVLQKYLYKFLIEKETKAGTSKGIHSYLQ
jgi:hypothetical protein